MQILNLPPVSLAESQRVVMLRERVIQELADIREKRIAEIVDDEQAKELVMTIVQKFCEDLGFSDVSMAIIEAWQNW